MERASLARITAAILIFQAGCALAAPATPIGSSTNSGKLIEGRALYETQVNFGGARENDFGVPLDSKTPIGADAANMFR